MESFIVIVSLITGGLLLAALVLLVQGGKRRLIEGIKWFFGKAKEFEGKVDFTVTVVVPAYNEEKHIEKTVKSIQAQTYPIQRIIVVDDSSTDRTDEVSREAGAEVIRTPENTGTKSKAFNFALPLIDSEITVGVDADTILDARAVEEILKPFINPDIVVSCGFVIPQRIKTLFERARFLQYLEYFTLHKETQNHWGIPLVASGCFFAVRTAVLKEFGGFTAKSIAEDMEFTWRVLMAKKKVVLMSRAISFPLDPDNLYLYKRQVLRWYRGFLQNIGLHWKHLWRQPKLAVAVGWYLILGILQLFFLLGFLITALWRPSLFLLGLKWLALAFTIKAFVLLIIALQRGAALGKRKIALASIPHYFVVAPLDSWLFWKSLWQEWIRRRRLNVWEKGH